MNILLTSVGRRSYLVQYFKEALNGIGKVHAANSSNLSPAFQFADHAIVTPIIYDKNYIPYLLDYCKHNNIGAIISLFDIDLPILSKNKKYFTEIGTTVVVSDKNVLDICNDKWKTYQFLLQNGFAAPKTYISLPEVLEDIETGKVSYPLMVKPRWGMGSIAIFEAENEQELQVFYEKTKRNILKTYLKYESQTFIEKSVIIQEKLNGQEYGLDVINDLNGKYQTTISKMKYAMRSGETDCAVTVEEHSLKNIGKKLSGCLHHIANLDVDVFIVEEKAYVLEMNARFGGGYPFSHMAGVNLPLAIVNWLQSLPVEKKLLTERINIMSQKDINLVRLHMKPEFTIQKLDSEKDIYQSLIETESLLIPTLIERDIDIRAYSQKLSEWGNVWGIKGAKGETLGLLASYSNDTDTKTAYLTILAITPSYRGLHLAEELLTLAEKNALECKMVKFKLEVRKNNDNAIGFYERFGYQIIGDATIDSFYMEKKL